MAVCSECGAENPPDARFCGNCRHAFAPPLRVAETATFTAGTGAAAASPPSPVPKAAVDSAVKVLVIIGTLLIPLLGIIMGLVYMASPVAEKKEVGRLWLMVGAVAFVLYAMCFLAGGG